MALRLEVLGVYLPAWAYYWRRNMLQLRNWVRVGIGFVVILHDWDNCTAHVSTDGIGPDERLRTLDSQPELGIVVGWAVVALALVSICAIASRGTTTR